MATIAAGTRLGPYEILAPLGAGGMGEVFRARDTRLSREVAIKVLPAAVASDPERLKRFEKEARSASALNHPSIVTIFDLGQTEGVSWIAMELVEGATVRELLAAGPLPIKKLLALAPQIAEGLAKAHEAGIVHRDLKPENVMVTKDGLVKILDFGLAKLSSTGSGSGEGSQLPTMTGTTPGVVVGTVGYMSPEQAGGEKLDFRSDQFSFGSVLYEMATGKRAFQKKTAIDTLGAILNSEPEPIANLNPNVPAPLRWIVERCLSKEPRQRYASTEDLARELASIRDHLSESLGTVEPRRKASRGRTALWLTVASAIVLGIVAGILASRWRPHGESTARFSRVTFRPGAIGTARFAPDGETVIYSAVFEGRPSSIFSARPGVPESRALGILGADLFSLSSSAELALGMQATGILARASLAGGAPRELMENVEGADWAPNGKDLAIARRIGGMVRLEYPVGKTLYESEHGVGRPRISPDGARVAIYVAGTVLVLDREGRKTDLKDIGWGPTWSPAGTEIIDYVIQGSATVITATNLRGKTRSLVELPGAYYLHDVSRTGRLLLERVFMRNEVLGLVAGQDREQDLSWLDTSVPADLSTDGTTLLFFDNAGAGVAVPWAYVRKTDGSDAVRIGEGLARALSPDGKWALSVPGFSPTHLDLLPTGAGQPRSLPLGQLQFQRSGSFFPDGKRILVQGSMPGQDVRLYVLSLDGGDARPISPAGHILGAALPISPDGKQILSRAADGKLYFLDADGSGAPRAVAAFPESAQPIRWCADGRRVFARDNLKVYRVDLASGGKELWREFNTADRGQLDIVLPTPDGTSYVTGYHRYLSDLWVVDGVK